VNTATLNQMFLINLPDIESVTRSTGVHACRQTKSGDIGELEFDLECARLNFAPFRPALSNGSIDRLLLLPNGIIKRIHIKTAVLRNGNNYRNITEKTKSGYRIYEFVTRNSTEKADFYFCCGLDQNFQKTAIWWIPWCVIDRIYIPSDGYKFESYLKNPFEFLEKKALCP